jgi:hypothetical protein
MITPTNEIKEPIYYFSIDYKATKKAIKHHITPILKIYGTKAITKFFLNPSLARDKPIVNYPLKVAKKQRYGWHLTY